MISYIDHRVQSWYTHNFTDKITPMFRAVRVMAARPTSWTNKMQTFHTATGSSSYPADLIGILPGSRLWGFKSGCSLSSNTRELAECPMSSKYVPCTPPCKCWLRTVRLCCGGSGVLRSFFSKYSFTTDCDLARHLIELRAGPWEAG